MDNKEDREWVLENVESINADVKDIDELCCALEHSTIFAIDYIQTFGTRLIDLDYKYKNQQQELERYKNIIENIEKLVRNQLYGAFVPTGRTDGKVLQEIERKIEELKGSDE